MPKVRFAGGTAKWLLKWRQIHQALVMDCCAWQTTSRPFETEVRVMLQVWHHQLHARNAVP